MKLANKIIKTIRNPAWFVIFLNNRGLHIFDDERYLKILFRLSTGKKLNLDSPETFNEKLQWLKINNRRDIYTVMVDKFDAKRYVASIIGEEYIIPTLGVYERFDDIDFNKLPNQFVIKCTHDSGGLVICKDKKVFDNRKAKKKITKCLKKNFYWSSREWPYKNVKPRIIIEKYMEDAKNKSMRDYKVFCFDGNPAILYISDDSHTANQKIAFFDKDYNQLPIKRKDYRDYSTIPQKPKNFKKMLELSSLLSKGIPHLRVDWYEINGKLYFGELTFFTCSGMIPFESDEWDKKLGNMIDLEDGNVHR